MQPGVERVQRHLVMLIVGRGDYQRLKAAAPDHLAVIAEHKRDGILLGQLIGPGAVTTADRGKLGAGMTLQAR